MGIQLNNDIVLGKEIETYNNFNRIESLDLLSGTSLVRIGKYWDKTFRDAKPNELLVNNEYITVELTTEELEVIKKILYTKIVTQDKYSNGIKILDTVVEKEQNTNIVVEEKQNIDTGVEHGIIS